MNLNVLDESATNVGDVKDMPRFPAVQRDFAFVMKEEMPVGDVMNEMKAIAGELCEEVHLFDIYRGVPIQPGREVRGRCPLRCARRTARWARKKLPPSVRRSLPMFRQNSARSCVPDANWV